MTRNDIVRMAREAECSETFGSDAFTIAAEELVRSEGEATGAPDEYRIPQCQADDHMMECIQHLKWAGEAMSHETDDGYIVVMFQDLTLSSLAG